MYMLSCDRKRFADFISNSRPLVDNEVRQSDSIHEISLKGNDLLLVWQRPPVEKFLLPNAIVVAEDGLKDFIAWALTYFRHIRPITAHCRILTPSLAKMTAEPVLSSNIPDIAPAIIGMIIAEGITYSVGRIDLNRLPLSAFSRTLSFVYAEAIEKYGNVFSGNLECLETTRNGWISTRKMSNQPDLNMSASDISGVWTLVTNAIDRKSQHQTDMVPDYPLLAALQSVKETGSIPGDLLRNMSDKFHIDDSLSEIMKGPREIRVKAVDAAIHELAKGPDSTKRQRSFLAGYLASLVQPGAIDHFQILFPVRSELPESFLWYGAFSGLNPGSSVFNYGNGIGWLINRELERPSNWLDRPDCDIALTEMEILMRDRGNSRLEVRTFVSGLLRVELFPLIYTNVKWSESIEGHVSDQNSYGQQMTFFSEEVRLKRDVLELLSKIGETSSSLNAIRRQVEAKFGLKAPKERKKPKN